MALVAQSRLGRTLEFGKKAISVVGLALLMACSSTAPAPAAENTRSPVWSDSLDGAVDGTPAVAGGVVFAGSAGGRLGAFDLETGAGVWLRTGLGPISDSPAVDSGRVFVGTLSGRVLAFRASDGLQLWDWVAPVTAAMWSSPVVYRGVVIIGLASPYGDTPLVPGRVVGLDAMSGRELWEICLLRGCAPGDGVWSTATIDAEGNAFIGVGNPGDGVLAFDPLTGERKWLTSLNPDNNADLDVGARPLILQVNGRELVFETGVGGSAAELDAANGMVVLSRTLVEGSAVHGLIATPAFDGIDVYVASASPPTGVIALSPRDEKIVWRHATDESVYSAPAVAGGTLVVGTGAVFGDLNKGSIVALSTVDGKEVWRYDTHSAVRGGPAMSGDLVLVGDYRGDLMAFRLSSA